jgi:hypothetical protein
VQADVRLEDCMDLEDSVGLVPLLAQAHDEVLHISPSKVSRCLGRQAALTGLMAWSSRGRLRFLSAKAYGFAP